MNTIIEEMMQAYDTPTIQDQKNAMKEVIQEIVLCGLSRAGFFNKAAFYGGTALRIFYGLDRFSEDLDFSLMTADQDFDIKSYFSVLEKETRAYGLSFRINEKEKKSNTDIQSAFLKGNMKEHLMMFCADDSGFSSIPNNEVIKIKFEIDVNPPAHAAFERRYRLRPIPYEIALYDDASLLAGKIHAVISRAWKNRVKGRDLYDYVFYLSKGIPVNRRHLQARLIQSGHLTEKTAFTLSDVKRMLNDRFEVIDFSQAKEDVAPFLKDTSELDLWSADFFRQITDRLTEKE